jgi:single-strand DNA-binding protein
MMNSVNLTGRLVKDVDLRYTPGGVAVANVTLAVQRSFPNKETGEREADFPQIIIFNKQAENVANFLHKGSLVAVEGRLQTRSYEKEDPAGNYTVYVTEVVANAVHFLESKKEEQGKSSQNNPNHQRQSGSRGGRR